MSLEGFVRASGAVMGMARASFGVGGVRVSGPVAVAGSPTGAGAGSGAAAQGFGAESGLLDDHIQTLGEHDQAGAEQAHDAMGAAGSGRDRMEAIVTAAIAEVTAMGASTNTVQGQRALVAAIRRRLEETKSTVQSANNDAQTRAASADVTAASYDGPGRGMAGAATPMPAAGMPMMVGSMPMMGAGMPSMGSGSAMGSMAGGAMPLAPLAGLMSMIRPQHSASDSGLAAGMVSAHGRGGAGRVGDRIAERALSQLGVRYSWGGGNGKGPTAGGDGVGFDCSGLVQYAYAGAGIEVPRTTYDLAGVGVAVSRGQAQPGDIVLSNYSRPDRPEHVQIVLSPTQVVEAPHAGATVKISDWPSGAIQVRRLI